MGRKPRNKFIYLVYYRTTTSNVSRPVGSILDPKVEYLDDFHIMIYRENPAGPELNAEILREYSFPVRWFPTGYCCTVPDLEKAILKDGCDMVGLHLNVDEAMAKIGTNRTSRSHPRSEIISSLTEYRDGT